jgi:hypothetical protein
MSGCAPDLFLITTVPNTPLQVDDTCPTTGVPIHVDFTPSDHRADLVDAADPTDTLESGREIQRMNDQD